jgi:hypothetical protein
VVGPGELLDVPRIGRVLVDDAEQLDEGLTEGGAPVRRAGVGHDGPVGGAAQAPEPLGETEPARLGHADHPHATVCRDHGALYDYLATRLGTLPGLQHVESAPVVRRVKRSTT